MKLKQKLQKLLKKKPNRNIKDLEIDKLIWFASTLPLSPPLYYYCDADGTTEFLTQLPSFRYDKVIIQNLMEQEFPSFSPVHGTTNVTMNSTDFEKLILHYHQRIETLADVTNSTFAEAAHKYAEYLEEKRIFVQPVGWEAVTHRFINVGYLIQNGFYTFSSTATAHLKGYTGSAYLTAAPAVSLTTIFVGGL